MMEPESGEVLRATFVRDFWMATSYRLGFLLSLGGSLIGIVGVFFLSEAVGLQATGSIAEYGDSYFGFAVIGVAISGLLALGLGGIAARVREAQMMGTLELMVLSPNRLGTLILGSSLWGHAQEAVALTLYLILAVVLGMEVTGADVPVALASLVLSVLAFNALGMVAASVVIVVKQGNPVSFVIGMASVLAAGVLYPTSVLPGWIQAIGQLLPLTHSLELIRRSVLNGEGLDTLWGPFFALLGLTVVLLPLGLWACHIAVRIAQTDGSLAEY
jgi:ABC-2 type transport system permease protein